MLERVDEIEDAAAEEEEEEEEVGPVAFADWWSWWDVVHNRRWDIKHEDKTDK